MNTRERVIFNSRPVALLVDVSKIRKILQEIGYGYFQEQFLGRKNFLLERF